MITLVSDPQNSRTRDVADEARAAIRSAILRYLQRNPRASDSVVGICEWWLVAEGIRAYPLQLEEVLKTMVGEGLLQATRLGDDTVIYARGDRCGPAGRE